MELFVARGYDAVSVQEIVEQSGLTKPTLYHHFGNKRGVLTDIAGRVATCLFETIGDAAAYDGDAPRDLERLIERLLAFSERYPIEARLLLAAQNGPVASEARGALLPVWDRLSREVEQFFLAASGDHGNMRGREREYTVSLLGVVFAYAVLRLENKLGHDPTRAHEIMRQFSYGIYS